jgi:phosphatidylserine/phosphatidylglycerophosphate/cardiolipin synthase-like enzyme
MFASIIVGLAVAATPTPTGTKDIVTGIYYAPSNPPPSAVATALCGSAASSLTVATWSLQDRQLAAALCRSATAGLAVRVAIDASGGTDTTQSRLAQQIKASGGSVWRCNFPRKIANNFVTADGNYTATGNYYFSPTAQQIGSYLITISGTTAAYQSAVNFDSLISGGTLLASSLSPTPCAVPPTSYASVSVMFSPRGGCRDAIISTINNATSTVRLAGYTFTDQNIANSLVAAKTRGVDVQCVFDASALKNGAAALRQHPNSNRPARIDNA